MHWHSAGLPLKRLLTEKGIKQLRALPLTPVLSQQRDEWLELVALMNKRIATVVEHCSSARRTMRTWLCCKPIPGIGLLTALALRYTLLPISRFSTTRKVTAKPRA